MRLSTLLLLLLLGTSGLSSQSILTSHDPAQPLTPQLCMDLIKTVWDSLKTLSDEHRKLAIEKDEFESTSEYADRVKKNNDDFITRVRSFYSDNKFNAKAYSVMLKADLNKYNADNQTYGITSSTQILLQPKKSAIAVIMPVNKYVSITEKNTNGYRRAYLHLKTNPEFTWFVNKQTAQDAKQKESSIQFKFTFSFDISYNEATQQVLLQIVPARIALMNQSDNFTYWSEDIR
jgi:hypothetical protein